jgi:two-component system response regulator DesR
LTRHRYSFTLRIEDITQGASQNQRTNLGMVDVIRVLIAEEIQLFRSGLVALLADEPDLTVVEAVDNGKKVASAARHSAPDVALIDLDLTDLDGFTATREVCEAEPGCAVILMAARRRPGDLKRAVAAGAVGFVLKDSSPTELSDAIRHVARGERVIDADLAFAELGTVPTPLTPRELDVLSVAAEGATVREIAERLFLTTGTVRNYLSRVVTKTGARTRVEAVTIAHERGWLWSQPHHTRQTG